MQDNHLLKLYKAAAGSGKTYTLTQEYLRYILRPYTQVSDILAITFTNAATADMKRKIIEALGTVAHGEYPDWKNLLDDKVQKQLKTHPENESETYDLLKKQALKKQKMLLHQYQDFSVKTIDSFVQNLIKPFAFELGLPQNYTPSIEIDALCDEITQRILDDCGPQKNTTLTGFLQSYLQNREDEEKSLNVSESIHKVVALLFDERSIKAIESLHQFNADEFKPIIQHIKDYCQNIENQIEKAWESAHDCILQNQLEPTDFHGGSRGFYTWFSKPADYEKYASPSDTVRKNIDKGIFKNNAYSHLTDIFLEAFETVTSIDYPTYALSIEIIRNIYILALLNHAKGILDEIKERTAVIPISEFNQKIDEALAKEGNDFIFERSGTRYRHVFIDEFQDTSHLQWKNLIPLIENNLAQGNECLIVGDPKQSIYRFRNADLEQFVKLCANEGKLKVKVHTLKSNWRSQKGIIAFNNAFYRFIKAEYPFTPGPDDSLYTEMLRKQETGLTDKISSFQGHESDQQGTEFPQSGGILPRLVFSDHEQYYKTETEFLPEAEPESVRIIQARNMSGDYLDAWILEQTEKVLARHQPGEVAILCHKNKHCSMVADYLVRKGYKVSTPDSLKLGSHQGLNLLVSSLEYIESGEEYHAAGTYIMARQLNLWPQVSLVNDIHEDWKSKDCQHILKKLRSLKENQVDIYDTVEATLRFWNLNNHTDQYILCFLDYVQKMQCSSIGQLVEWWNDKGTETCISAPSNEDAIRIMSIHKSKGLEFDVVILPFISDHKLDSSKLYWTPEGGLPKEFELPTALVRYIGKLSETIVGDDMQREKQRIEIDNLNALYVATTRPKHKLYLINQVPTRNSNSFASNIAISNFAARHPEYIEYEEDGSTLISKEPDSSETTGSNEDKDSIFQFGNSDTTMPVPEQSFPMQSREWRKHYKASFPTEDEEPPSPEQKWGLFIHKALSCLQDSSPSSQSRSIHMALSLYPEFKSMEQETMEILESVCNHPVIKPYLGPDYLAKNETTLATSPGKDLRPDRVCIKGNTAVILDYKTGEPRDGHIRQVQEYMLYLQQMGMAVKGFLVYVNNDHPHCFILPVEPA